MNISEIQIGQLVLFKPYHLVVDKKYPDATNNIGTTDGTRTPADKLKIPNIKGVDVHVIINNTKASVRTPMFSKEYKFEGISKLLSAIAVDITDKKAEIFDRTMVIEKGKKMKPRVDDLSKTPEVQEVHHNPKAPRQEQYIAIVGAVSSLTKGINQEGMLKDAKEVAEAFMKAKKEIEGLATTKATSAGGGNKKTWISKYFGKTDPTATPSGSKASVQDNIDYLFGLVHEKYEKLVTTGERLQSTKGLLAQQLVLLGTLEDESEAFINTFEDATLIPMRDMALDTQIKSSVEKYKDRLLKIDGAILATQTTIISLGKDLPAMKTDLTDEMAISQLLTDVADYQAMYSEIASLVSDVTTNTSEKTHDVIESVLTMQIEDTHSIDYLRASSERGERFAEMITDKSQQLASKTMADANEIREIAARNTTQIARQSINLIESK